MCNGVVTVDAEGDQDIGGRICDARLHELDHFAGHIPGTPFDGDAPHDIRQHVQQSHAQV